MKIIVLGGDGYLGWPTAMYLSEKGHEVTIVDNFAKRTWEQEIGVPPFNPPPNLSHRVRVWKEVTHGKVIKVQVCDIAENPALLYKIFEGASPDAVVHYAEQPSAPYSMISRGHAVYTQRNNVIGTLNLIYAILHHNRDIHIVKLGTMGEYGTPNIDIEEGWLELEHRGRKDRVLFPKRPGSLYHLSKVHDSHNLEFACRTWGLHVTDLNQGIVYGMDTNETVQHPDLRTSFHYDEVFGTVLNRFCAQVIAEKPLTVYGSGNQTRGFLNIRDTLKCVELALLHPANSGEFRVFNQFTEQFSVNQLAGLVSCAARSLGKTVITNHIPDPRVEAQQHYYKAIHTELESLGFVSTFLTQKILRAMLTNLSADPASIDAKSLENTSVIWNVS